MVVERPAVIVTHYVSLHSFLTPLGLSFTTVSRSYLYSLSWPAAKEIKEIKEIAGPLSSFLFHYLHHSLISLHSITFRYTIISLVFEDNEGKDFINIPIARKEFPNGGFWPTSDELVYRSFITFRHSHSLPRWLSINYNIKCPSVSHFHYISDRSFGHFILIYYFIVSSK